MKKTFYYLSLMAMVCIFSAVSLQGQTTITVPGPYGPTIQAAINAAGAGDTINVAAGVYHEQIIIAKMLIINGADGAILDGTGLAPVWTTGVKIKSGNVTFNNIDVTNFTQDGIIIGYEAPIPGSLKNVHVTNCKISNIQPGYWGFGIYAGYEAEAFKYSPPKLTAHLDYSGLLIEGNEIENAASSSLVLQSITGTPGTIVVRNNYIHDGENDGIWIDCARNIVIQDNTLLRNMDAIYISSYADMRKAPLTPGLNGPYSPKNIQITGNQILDSIEYGGIYLEAGWPATIFMNGNTITGNTPDGVANYLSEQVDATNNWWGDASGPSSTDIYGNVLYSPWKGKMASFIVEEAKIDFKKKPEDDKIRVKGTLEFAPGYADLTDSEMVFLTIKGFSGGEFSDNVVVLRKEKQDKWEYKRPKGADSGIKEIVVDITKKEIKFDIHVDNAEIGTSWTNPVFISFKIGNNYGQQSIIMEVKKDKMEYRLK